MMMLGGPTLGFRGSVIIDVAWMRRCICSIDSSSSFPLKRQIQVFNPCEPRMMKLNLR